MSQINQLPFLLYFLKRQLQTVQAIWSTTSLAFPSLTLLFSIYSVSESSVSNKLCFVTLAFFFAFLTSVSSCSCSSTTGVVETYPVFVWTCFLCFFVFPVTDLVSYDCGGPIASMIAF